VLSYDLPLHQPHPDRVRNLPQGMVSVSNVLERTIDEIEKRLKELRPLIAEHDRLEQAYEALTGAKPPVTTARRRKTSGARKTTARPTAGRPARGGRKRGSGARGAQARKLIEANPGITIPELATRMKMKPNYLYRVVPQLQKEGKIAKEGKGWKAA